MSDRTWQERLDQAYVDGRFTMDDVAAAGAFDTCAVGEALDMSVSEMPVEFWRLGYRFHRAVSGGHVALATRLYEEIAVQARRVKGAA